MVVLDPFGSFEPIGLRVDGDHGADPLVSGPMPTPRQPGEWWE